MESKLERIKAVSKYYKPSSPKETVPQPMDSNSKYPFFNLANARPDQDRLTLDQFSFKISLENGRPKAEHLPQEINVRYQLFAPE